MKQADFMVIGVMRSGTTSIFHDLAEHPQLIAPRQKEINYFAVEERFEKGDEFYRDFFPEPQPGKLRFEVSPFYFTNSVASMRIREFYGERFKEMPFFVLLRDPVARAWSEYQGLKVTNKTLNESVFDDPKSDIVRRGRYIDFIDWWEMIGAKLFIFQAEHYFGSPQEVLSAIYETVGVKAHQNEVYHNVDQWEWRKNRNGGYPGIPENIKDKLTAYYAPHTDQLKKQYKGCFDTWES